MNRYSKANCCPICGGHPRLRRGTNLRCYGFLSDDAQYAHCTREEYAGKIPMNSSSQTYAHALNGQCHCGMSHGGGLLHSGGNRFNNTRVVETYSYEDANGNLLFEVVRREPKGFCQRRPGGADGWIWNLTGVVPVLYRLPSLLAANPAELVYVVEGEKDADRLTQHGFIATTNPMGAGKWRPDYSKTLRGRSVVLFPDNDPPGRDHMQAVAKSLNGVARSIKWVELPNLPPKGDVSDWLAAGGTSETLRKLVADASEYRPTGEKVSAQYREGVWAERKLKFQTPAELAAVMPTDVNWVAPPWVAAGSMTILSGKVKAGGKTTWVLRMVAAVLDASPFMGRDTTKTAVVYLTEQPSPSFLEALKMAGLLERNDLLTLQWNKTVGFGWLEVTKAAIQECQKLGARLLIVDTLPQFAQLSGDAENNSGDALAAMRPLQEAMAQGIAVLLVVHDRKSGGEVGDSGRGSSAFAGTADIVLSIRRLEGNHRPTFRRIEALSRFAETPSACIVELTASGYIAHGDAADVTAQENEAKLLKLLPASEAHAITLDQLMVATNAGRSTIQRTLDALGLHPVGTGKRGDAYRYHLPPSFLSAQTPSLNGQKETGLRNE